LGSRLKDEEGGTLRDGRKNAGPALQGGGLKKRRHVRLCNVGGARGRTSAVNQKRLGYKKQMSNGQIKGRC